MQKLLQSMLKFFFNIEKWSFEVAIFTVLLFLVSTSFSYFLPFSLSFFEIVYHNKVCYNLQCIPYIVYTSEWWNRGKWFTSLNILAEKEE